MSSLTPGTRIGPYEITGTLGAGGMGEVYRARDTRLKREVALKILPESFASDPDRLARFQREAEVLASLNHPNIAAIHGFEEGPAEAGHYVRALVLELVEGETLADRIARGPIALDEALPIARQIAEALEAAHERGIIHRDLKPANIKITPDGVVKVLDFGLAKALEPAEAGPYVPGVEAGFSRPDVTASPTITSPALMTGVGMLLGTAAYMSPEQARGRVADRRSDIWAFGCVLYEMCTGTRVFDGDDVSDTLAAVLRAEPDISRVPEQVRALLPACLQKDPKQRLQSVGDFRFLIDEAEIAGVAVRRPRIWTAVAAIGTIAMIGAGVVYVRGPESNEAARRLQIGMPPDSAPGFVALSPDGRTVLITRGALWRRSLDATALEPLAGTTGARGPFWSPDSRFIAFFADGKLKVIPAAGGPVNEAGTILFDDSTGSLDRVTVSGGPCEPVITADGEGRLRFPVFLPDGRHFMYVATGGEERTRGLHVATLDEPQGQRVLADVSSALFAPSRPQGSRGRLVFLRQGALMAQAFDAASLVLDGDATSIANDAGFTASAPQVAASVSADAQILVYLTRPDERFQLTWFDRSGKEIGTIGTPEDERHVALSPGEAFVATVRDEGGQGVAEDSAIWLHDTARAIATRFAIPGFAPVWSPQGDTIALSSLGDLFIQDAGGGAPEAIVRNINRKTASDWSAAADTLVYTEVDPQTQGDIWVVRDPEGAREAVPFLRTEFTESQGRISKDGRWIAYSSNESGRTEIYVQRFPEGGGKLRISHEGGVEPAWREDGAELYYLVGTGIRGTVMAVPLSGDSERLQVGVPRSIFDFPRLGFITATNIYSYSPTSDGTKFLVNVQVSDRAPAVNIITSWQQLLSGANAGR